MKHTEYIIPIGEDAQDYDEIFIGVIRRQPELVRCKDCKYYQSKLESCRRWISNDGLEVVFDVNPDGFCDRAERKEE